MEPNQSNGEPPSGGGSEPQPMAMPTLDVDSWAAPPVPRGRRMLAGFIAVVIVMLSVVACVAQPQGDAGSSEPDVDRPPAGTVWFGTVDRTTMTMPSHVTTVPVDTEGLSFLAVLSRTIINEDVTTYVTKDGGNTVSLGSNNSGATKSDMYGGPVPVLVSVVPGTFVFDVKDAEGKTLATGTLVIR